MRDSLRSRRRSRRRMRWERRRVARKPEHNNSETTTKKIFGALFILCYLTVFILVSLGLLISGGFNEPVGQLFHFFTTGTIDTANKTFSWGNWWFVTGFIVLEIWTAILISFFIQFVLRKKSDMLFEKFEALLKLSPLKLIYHIAAGATAEEVLFRWIPLGVLYPVWGTDTALWTLIIGSSILFGFVHITNQKPENRNPLHTLPQVVGGFVLSYLFLAFGFEAAAIAHFLFNLVLFILVKIIYEVGGRKALQKEPST